MSAPDLSFEKAWYAQGARWIAGVDEVGRGPLSGPVMAAAVVLDLESIPLGLNDSKQVSPKRRAELVKALIDVAQIGVGSASVQEIDAVNIRQATFLAMRRAIAELPQRPDAALIDGRDVPKGLPCPAQAIIKGDGKSLSIAAASIVAKQARDALMIQLAAEFPGYGWDRNMGYPTKEHREALTRLGISPHHRRSFKPVHNILYQEK